MQRNVAAVVLVHTGHNHPHLLLLKTRTESESDVGASYKL